jgi:hypothetical protein
MKGWNGGTSRRGAYTGWKAVEAARMEEKAAADPVHLWLRCGGSRPFCSIQGATGEKGRPGSQRGSPFHRTPARRRIHAIFGSGAADLVPSTLSKALLGEGKAEILAEELLPPHAAAAAL